MKKTTMAVAGRKTGIASLLPALLLASSLTASGQFTSTPVSQTLYPVTGTGALNLDKNNTKYLSNFSTAGTGPLTGNTIELAGWSTDTDGGFSYALARSMPPFTYTGKGAEAIPNARDVQVGYLELMEQRYIIASYYDVAERLYAYDLYQFKFSPPGTVNVFKLYTYHFQDPDFTWPAYIPTTDYIIDCGGCIPGHYPAPAMTSTMGYNRISMDISKEGNKVVMTMTNNDNGTMYLAAGVIAPDTVLFSPDLPGSLLYPAASTGIATETPVPPFTCTFMPPWTAGAGGNWDLKDMSTGFFVRYYPMGVSGGGTPEYVYSYYPIDRGLFLTIVNAGTGYVDRRTSVSGSVYSPLIGIKAASNVLSPGRNTYFNQYWPDVCFQGNDVRMVFYANNPDPGTTIGRPNGAEDLYVTTGFTFNDFYTYTGATPSLTSYRGPTHMWVPAYNSFDGKALRQSPTTMLEYTPTTWSSYDVESLCKSLPLAPGEEMRAKIDAPDGGGGTCVITFAYSGVPAAGYSAYYPASVWIGPGTPSGSPPHPTPKIVPVHSAAEYGKKNIYVRYAAQQVILTNNSIAGSPAAINMQQNTGPAIAFKPSSTSNVAVAWASEAAGARFGLPWSYVGMELNTSVPITSSSYLASGARYMRLPDDPAGANSCGTYPLVALSKHNDRLDALYTCFTQIEGSTYSVQHKDHPWTSVSAWKGTATLPAVSLSVAPNPFSNTLHVQCAEALSLRLVDITGRGILDCSGAASDVNRQLDRSVANLVPGIYLVEINTVSGSKEVFKVVKQ